ncbi:uncharacterized protein BDZ99DRAFT_398878 [Mytilinidion resinicola]|uniref:Rhodopsin domain-containing protein n=1 Tax=Mytilinidion resinicola TaxID=574789 RepID=A0A6A6Y687_9PEZI|nr:uncharacterized protein BDZ99DRAFT_398878 [Mytilinidion resinicola]KAF2804033.1 hypothetical protein BDZ99DRAFT_398878 [Mytilinidion resinicola]
MVSVGGLGWTVIAVMIVETLMAATFLSARFWARIRLLGGLRSDDYLLLATLIYLAVVTILCALAAREGFGQHSNALTIEENVAATKLLIISQTFLCLCVWFSKVATADFLLKIVTQKWHKIFLYFCMISVSVLGAVVFVGFYTQCSPLGMAWDPRIQGKCYINVTVLGTVNAAYTTAIDFILAGLPWLFLRKLQMKPKEKLIINLSLSVGIFAGVCGIIRVTKAASLSAKSDYTYETVELQLWSTTETTVSIMCLCFPVLRPLWRRYVKGLSKGDSSNGPFSSRERGYQLSGRTNTTNKNGNTFTVSASVPGIKHSKQPDNDSADSILGEDFRMHSTNPHALGGIKETKSVVIEYDDRDTERSQSGRSV